MKHIIKNEIKIISENIQQAYAKFKNDDIVTDDIIKDVAENIFNKNYVYLVCNLYKQNIQSGYSYDTYYMIKELKFYLDTKAYLKLNLNDLYFQKLIDRNKTLKVIKDELPPLFLRNNRDIRDNYDDGVENVISQLINHVQQYQRKTEIVYNKVLNIVSAKNKSIDDILYILESGELGEKIDEEYMENIMNGNNQFIEPYEVIWNKNGKYLVKIDSNEGLEDIGAGTFWCHTYKNNNYFYEYSINGSVFVLVDTDDTDDRNLMTVTKELYDQETNFLLAIAYNLGDGDGYYDMVDSDEFNGILYDSMNRSIDNPHLVLMGFFETDDYEEIIDFFQ